MSAIVSVTDKLHDKSVGVLRAYPRSPLGSFHHHTLALEVLQRKAEIAKANRQCLHAWMRRIPGCG